MQGNGFQMQGNGFQMQSNVPLTIHNYYKNKNLSIDDVIDGIRQCIIHRQFVSARRILRISEVHKRLLDLSTLKYELMTISDIDALLPMIKCISNYKYIKYTPKYF